MHPHLEIRDTDRCGRGVFAKTDIAVGERLCVMGGYIVPVAEEIDDYGLQIDENFVLSSGGGEHDCDYFNHNCAPNAGTKGKSF